MIEVVPQYHTLGLVMVALGGSALLGIGLLRYRRFMRRLVGPLVCGLVVAFALSSCQRAGVYGDSITAFGASQIHTAFDPHFDTTVDGVPSATIAQRADAISAYAATNPSVFVMELGANDALNCSVTTPQDWDNQMAKFAAGTVKVGVTVYSHSHWSDCMDAKADQLNTNIRLGAFYGLWRIVDWDQTVTNYIAAGSPYGPILKDGLHPTDAGNTRLAQDEETAAAS